MKNGKCSGTVRFAIKRKINVKTVKRKSRKHLNRGGVRTLRKNLRKKEKKVQYALRSASTAPRRKRYGTVRYGKVGG